ncbi:glutamine synthetase [bacterium]|nr:MAG: glutamine synthetase [bacterium]RKZ16558.1 MAG: glutamine synthetase [bacterium]
MGQSIHRVAPVSRADRIEALMEGSRADWTIESLADLARRESICALHLMHVGGDGWLKSLDFTLREPDQLESVLRTGERADGSSLFAGMGIDAGASDIVLRPRPETAFLDPFSAEPALVVLCGHLDRSGQPLDISPDTVVRRAASRLGQELDCELQALGEVEYFLGHRSDKLDAWGSDDRGYHATSPFVFGAGLRRRAMQVLEDVGVGVKYGHSEVGWMQAEGWTWEQHEIELALAPLPQAADAVVLTQWVLRNLAHEQGLKCSFAPVVVAGHAGSGAHFHFSPVRGGEHLGAGDSVESLGPEAQALIAGLVQDGGALMTWGNRDPSSFMRLAQGKESPETITWGCYNRKALVRIPIRARSGDGKTITAPTIEFRLPDGAVHPHLLLAGVAQAMVAAAARGGTAEVLERSESGQGAGEALPLDRAGIASDLQACRADMEADGVIPGLLVDAELERLCGD